MRKQRARIPPRQPRGSRRQPDEHDRQADEHPHGRRVHEGGARIARHDAHVPTDDPVAEAGRETGDHQHEGASGERDREMTRCPAPAGDRGCQHGFGAKRRLLAPKSQGRLASSRGPLWSREQAGRRCQPSGGAVKDLVELCKASAGADPESICRSRTTEGPGPLSESPRRLLSAPGPNRSKGTNAAERVRAGGSEIRLGDVSDSTLVLNLAPGPGWNGIVSACLKLRRQAAGGETPQDERNAWIDPR
jgi:hypothetical protein